MSALHPYPRKASLQAWLIVLTSALFFFYEFIQMNSFNAIGPDLQRLYGINATELGDLASMYFWGDVLFLFPAGMILDRMSVKRLILIGMAVCIVSTLGFAMSESLLLAKVFRFLEGIGAAFVLLSPLKLASRWFPLSKLALISGLVLTLAFMGGVVAQTPLTILVQHFGWREALYFDVVLGIVIMLLIMIIVKDYPPNQLQEMREEEEQLDQLGFWHSIGAALSNVQNWLCGLYTSLMNLPIMIFGVVWGSVYLQQRHNMELRDASWIVSMIFYGSIIGSPLIGWLSDYLQRRRSLMIACAVISIGLMLYITETVGLSFKHFIGTILHVGDHLQCSGTELSFNHRK